jgi:methionyl-tRNA synthetase
MRLTKFKPDDFETLYGIKSRLLDVPKEAVYMGSMLGILSPGESTRNHAHHDNEQFIIIDGFGTFCVGQKEFQVGKGDVIPIFIFNWT